ncbi:protein-glutamine gamma-glutamyltransferase 5-like [Mixophyes fleayi]|uniref:protein-glutamine gamma-glutamyltransferase 5-like n=1 Tax=Mixophyes fleayi TaxID=3061075 RepID=UPI003F4D9490
MDQVHTQNVDLQIKRNNTDHRTDEISTNRLIVRRGQDFKIRLEISNRSFKLSSDSIKFIIETGIPNLRQYEKKKVFGLSNENIKNDWTASIISKDSSSMEIKILPPADAIIGLHTLDMQINDLKQTKIHHLGEFIVLFNAWCPDDATFLENEKERKEYVMNENGFIFVGNANYISKRSWIYGQFDEDIVDICLKILDESLESHKNALEDYSRRNDPVYVSRVLSAMINSNDDNGVMIGRWLEPYDDGTRPTKWNGSSSILRQWFSSGLQPVKYGQCWVFASVLCTALRCLGIPTRVVTNFDSAHDTDGNLYIDQYFDEDKMLSKNTRDSVWNFHVWNESWMERRDLPPGYDGWQVLDATPQETSNGIYCCGPASVKAIKDGDIHLKYDCPFVFAEVNADVIKWFISPDKSKQEMFFNDSKNIGKHISTKNVGNNERMDITDSYKYDEGSKKERLVFKKALDMKNKPVTEDPKSEYPDRPSPNPPLRRIGLNLKLKLKEPPVFGQDVQLIVLITNLTPQKKKLNININAQTMENNGSNMKLIWQKSDFIKVKPNGEYTALHLIPYSVYKIFLSDSNLLKVSAVGKLTDTMEKLLVERKITLDSPVLQVETNEKAVVHAPLTVTVRFTNTLSEEISDCALALEGAGLVNGLLEKELGTLKPGKALTTQFELMPYKSGNKMLQVLFISDKIKYIREYIDIIVLPLPSI